MSTYEVSQCEAEIDAQTTYTLTEVAAALAWRYQDQAETFRKLLQAVSQGQLGLSDPPAAADLSAREVAGRNVARRYLGESGHPFRKAGLSHATINVPERQGHTFTVTELESALTFHDGSNVRTRLYRDIGDGSLRLVDESDLTRISIAGRAEPPTLVATADLMVSGEALLVFIRVHQPTDWRPR
ncbi:MAG: hypothetical protein ACYC6N_06555 [Pirellulaceae bacterium]